jgi:hypothetical protein
MVSAVRINIDFQRMWKNGVIASSSREPCMCVCVCVCVWQRWNISVEITNIHPGQDFNVASPEYTPRESLKSDVFWDVTPYGSCKNRRFGGT